MFKDMANFRGGYFVMWVEVPTRSCSFIVSLVSLNDQCHIFGRPQIDIVPC